MFLKKLRLILQSKSFYIAFFVVALVYVLFSYLFPVESKYDGNENNFKGILRKIVISSDYVKIEIMAKEKLSGTYYINQNDNILYEPGDKIEVTGTLVKPKHNTVPNLFDYHDYLKYRNQWWIMKVDNIKLVKENTSIYYKLKNKINNYLESFKSSNYLKTFLLGDQTSLDEEIVEDYREIGVSHLLAISGMQISLLGSSILILFKKIGIPEVISLIIVSSILLWYMFMLDCAASVVRATVFFCLLMLFKVLKIKTNTLYVFSLMISVILLFRPFIIFEVGFQYSVIICFFLIKFGDKIRTKSYLRQLLDISVLSFLVSLPITLYYFYQVNILGIIYNLFLVPFVSYIIFPFSLITFIFPFCDKILVFLVLLMENMALFFNNIAFGKLIFMKLNIIWIISYYLVFICFLKGRKGYGVLLSILVLFLYFYPNIFPKTDILMIDVGQGDSLLIRSNNQTMLIDTGGQISFSGNKSNIAKTKLIPLFKSLGIRKINYLVLTHGDYDHMGEASNLVNNFKVNKVVFNNDEFNQLEQDLIKLLDKKDIKYYKNIKELKIGDNKLYFLNNELYDNENDNSSVIYTEFNETKLLLMGDAGIEVEKDLLEKYNLKNIDIFKVGHHGSKTSSSKDFIDKIKPKYSIISVGKNNRYNHPNSEVLKALHDSTIYRTDINGSVMFKRKKDKLKIETCAP